MPPSSDLSDGDGVAARREDGVSAEVPPPSEVMEGGTLPLPAYHKWRGWSWRGDSQTSCPLDYEG